MSLIFEALRRSESERTGRPLSESTATELLRGAENGSADARAEKGEPKRLLDVATGGEAIGPKSDMPYSSFVESTVTEPRHAQESSFANTDCDRFERSRSVLPIAEKTEAFTDAQEVRTSVSP